MCVEQAAALFEVDLGLRGKGFGSENARGGPGTGGAHYGPRCWTAGPAGREALRDSDGAGDARRPLLGVGVGRGRFSNDAEEEKKGRAKRGAGRFDRVCGSALEGISATHGRDGSGDATFVVTLEPGFGCDRAKKTPMKLQEECCVSRCQWPSGSDPIPVKASLLPFHSCRRAGKGSIREWLAHWCSDTARLSAHERRAQHGTRAADFVCARRPQHHCCGGSGRGIGSLIRCHGGIDIQRGV